MLSSRPAVWREDDIEELKRLYEEYAQSDSKSSVGWARQSSLATNTKAAIFLFIRSTRQHHSDDEQQKVKT